MQRLSQVDVTAFFFDDVPDVCFFFYICILESF
jgi:hypothetical protein